MRQSGKEPPPEDDGPTEPTGSRGLATGVMVAHDNPVDGVEHDMSLLCWCQPTVAADYDGFIVTHRKVVQ